MKPACPPSRSSMSPGFPAHLPFPLLSPPVPAASSSRTSFLLPVTESGVPFSCEKHFLSPSRVSGTHEVLREELNEKEIAPVFREPTALWGSRFLPRMCQQRAEYVVPCSTQSQFPYLWSAGLHCTHGMATLGGRRKAVRDRLALQGGTGDFP